MARGVSSSDTSAIVPPERQVVKPAHRGAGVIQVSIIAYAYPESAGVSPAPEAAKMAALPGKARQVLAQTGQLNDPAGVHVAYAWAH